MRRSAAIFALVVTAAFLAPATWQMASSLGPVPAAPSGAPAVPLLHGPASDSFALHVPSAARAAGGAHAAGANAPAFANCATPASTGIWGSTDSNGQTDFYKSVKVQFDVPNDPASSGSNFNVTPCPNSIPTYVNGFWMNISTNVQIALAVVSIWGTSWSTQTQQFETPIQGYSPGPPYSSSYPANVSMFVNPPLFESASFYFNDYKDFWPGSLVFFNLSVTALNASPAIIRSSDTGNPAPTPAGTSDVPSWEFNVQSPWTSNNFSQDIQVSTTPNVLSDPAFDPNPDQPFGITISAINVGTGTTLTIPMAKLTIDVCTAGDCASTGSEEVYTSYFGPFNHSVEQVVNNNGSVRTLGPFPAGSNISFNVTAWVPWEGGAIDYIFGPSYNFTWSSKGGWWEPNAPLEDNMILTTDPSGLNSTPVALPTMTPVNITIHEAIQNVTIGSASVNFAYFDRYGQFAGTMAMTAETDNTSYLLIPGLPAGGNMTFSVLAKDIKGNIVASQNYSYYETGDLAVPPSASTGYLFFEAVDLSTGELFSNIPFTLSNSTWSEQGNVSVFGFGGVRPPAGLGFLPLAYGDYTLAVTVNGVTKTAAVVVNQAIGTPTVFYFASQTINTNPNINAPTFPLFGVIGIVGATAASYPVYSWFKERRRKAEAEQKRITL